MLAVDTTTPRGSVAVADGDEVRGELRLTSETTYSARLLPAIHFLLEGLGLSPLDVEGYAVATGPGSFTGLRVGLSTVQGLALAAGRQCLGVPALDVLAARMRRTAPSLAPIIDAHRGEVYAALYDADGRLHGERQVVALAEFLSRVPAVTAFLGDGVARYQQEILASHPEAVLVERSLYLAGTLARLAVPRLARGEGSSPAELRPVYLRGVDIRTRPS